MPRPLDPSLHHPLRAAASREVGEGREPYKALLHQALELAPEERRAFIEARLPAGSTRDEALALLDGVEHSMDS